MRHPHAPALRAALLLAIPLLVRAASADAQTIPSPYRFIGTRHDVGFFAGTIGDDRGALRLGPGGGPMMGARYGFHITGPATVEVTTFFVLSDREIYDPDGATGVELIGTEDAFLSGIDARARFALTGPRTWRGLQPFLLAGGGLVGDVAGSSDLEVDLGPGDQFSFGPAIMGLLGAGSGWFPSERLSLRLDVTLYLWRLGTPDSYLLLENQLGPVEEREWASALAILGGIHFRF